MITSGGYGLFAIDYPAPGDTGIAGTRSDRNKLGELVQLL
jgi:hypothetical protein